MLLEQLVACCAGRVGTKRQRQWRWTGGGGAPRKVSSSTCGCLEDCRALRRRGLLRSPPWLWPGEGTGPVGVDGVEGGVWAWWKSRSWVGQRLAHPDMPCHGSARHVHVKTKQKATSTTHPRPATITRCGVASSIIFFLFLWVALTFLILNREGLAGWGGPSLLPTPHPLTPTPKH